MTDHAGGQVGDPGAHGPPGAGPLLQVRDLAVAFPGHPRDVTAVDGVTFDITAGERLGIVGESGSGKSVTALAIMRLLQAPPARITGQVLLDGTDLLSLSRRRMRHVRGRRIAMIFQDPATCLSPRLTTGQQIVEAIRAHRNLSRAAARERALELLARAGIPAPDRWAGEYPHRLSGGMAQRVMIAMALSSEPDLIIADEPTTALDVTIEEQIIDLLLALCRERNTAVLLITHDLALEARFAERLMVMYAGRIVEVGPADRLFGQPSHPYTRGLLRSAVRADRPRVGALPTIPGAPASATNRPAGCPFHPRCPYFQPVCAEDTPALEVRAGDDRRCACHFAGQLPPVDLLGDDGRGRHEEGGGADSTATGEGRGR